MLGDDQDEEEKKEEDDYPEIGSGLPNSFNSSCDERIYLGRGYGTKKKKSRGFNRQNNRRSTPKPSIQNNMFPRFVSISNVFKGSV